MDTPLRLLRSLVTDLLDLVAAPLCPGCDAPFPDEPPLCAVCREALEVSIDPPPGVLVPYAHGGPLARAIYRAKYGDDPTVAESLGGLLVPLLDEFPPGPWKVTGVPLHIARLRSRGFNQSHELARAVARALGAPLCDGLLARCRDTGSQTHLDRDARRTNLRGAFRVPHPGAVTGARVLVIDDVVTTGATLHECLRTLRDAGATSATGMALARATLWLGVDRGDP